MAGLDSSFTTINLEDPVPWENRRPAILGLIISFLLSSWICVLGRLYTRLKSREYGWDDLCVVLYSIFTTAGSISICLSTNYGLGKHFVLIRVDQMTNFLRAFYIMNASYCTATVFIKEALLLQYLRVYGPGNRMYRITYWLVIFTGVWGFAYAFIAWVPCMPVSSFWLAPANAKCWGYGSSIAAKFVATYESHTAINMIIDVVVLLVPLPILFKDNTTMKQRWRILGLLILGSLVIMFAIWRLQTIVEHQASYYPTHDPTWYGPASIILAVLEVDAAAICASVPVFWPVLEAHWGSIFVTQEVKITHEDRYHESDRYSQHSQGSEVELHQTDSTKSPQQHIHHYQDSYVLRSVNPLHSPGSRGHSRAEAVVLSEGPIAKDGNYKSWLA